MKRRAFISLLSGAAAWPLAARAQQPAMPVIGFLDSRPADAMSERLRAFRQGLKDTGYVEGENLAIVYRFAENQADRLPELAADLVRRQVAVIATAGPPAVFAAKAATATIPTVFIVADDPVRLDLVASIARPGGNLTGINLFNSELVAKRLELLHELVPRATRVAVLGNRADEANTGSTLRDAEAAARAIESRSARASAHGKLLKSRERGDHEQHSVHDIPVHPMRPILIAPQCQSAAADAAALVASFPRGRM